MGFDNNALKEIQRKKRVEESKWKETHSKGLPMYILRKGILGLAFPSAFLMAVIMLINDSFSYSGSSMEFVLLVVFFIVVGSLYSFFVWNMNNRKYINHKSKKKK